MNIYIDDLGEMDLTELPPDLKEIFIIVQNIPEMYFPCNLSDIILGLPDIKEDYNTKVRLIQRLEYLLEEAKQTRPEYFI